jgi:hypothetical protein
MERKRRLAKTTALASSVVLLSIYVYDQAGGELFSRAPSTHVMPGSKSKQFMLAPSSVVSMPGPKSAPVFSADREPAVVSSEAALPAASAADDERKFLQPQSSPEYPRLPVTRPAMLPGSKASIIFEPRQAPAPQQANRSQTVIRRPRAPSRQAASQLVEPAAERASDSDDPFAESR